MKFHVNKGNYYYYFFIIIINLLQSTYQHSND